jgi:predicted nucleic acid-binding protein
MKPNLVVDTNIVVSALITKHLQASTRVILEQMITGQLTFFL